MKRVLFVSQATSKYYVDIIRNSLGDDAVLEVITGSNLGDYQYVNEPPYVATSIRTRLKSWLLHYRFIIKWAYRNSNKHFDIIYCTSNPPINAYIGIKLKQIFNAKFVYMYWDLYPQAIEASMHSGFANLVSVLWHKWNIYNFKRVNQIVTIGEIIKESIQKKIPYDLNIKVIPISVDTNVIKPIDKRNNLFITQNNLQDKFIVLYSGKMGRSHNIELILESATLLSDNNDIQFVFIGNGEKKTLVEKYITEKQCKNVCLYSLQTNEMFPFSIAIGDIGIVAQEKVMASCCMPSKTYSMMAAGEAIIGICSEHDDLKLLIDKNGIGIAISDNNANSVARAILDLFHDGQKLENMKNNARNLALNYYSTKEVTAMYRILFNNILDDN